MELLKEAGRAAGLLETFTNPSRQSGEVCQASNEETPCQQLRCTEGIGQLTAQFSRRCVEEFPMKSSYSCTIRLNWVEPFLTRTLSVSHPLYHSLGDAENACARRAVAFSRANSKARYLRRWLW